jgi:glycosyltransferase involved in cell wall biosynthesis
VSVANGSDAVPTVSVIITTFNRSALVVEAIESVLAQDFRDFELIVVNDGSTDDTREVLARYGQRIRCIHQPNAGLNAARNAAIDIARGQFFALLDDDDLWEPGKLALCVALARRFPAAGLVFSNFNILRGAQRITRDGLRTWHHGLRDFGDIFARRHDLSARELGRSAPTPERFNVYEGDVYEASLPAPWVLPAAGLVRRERVPAGLRFNEADSTCGDWEYFARLSRHSGCVFVDHDFAVNRSHEDAVRLTRLPRPIQLTRRVAMIERLWLADPGFMAKRGTLVTATLHDCLMKLARARLLASDRAGARQALARAMTLAPAPEAGRDAGRWLNVATRIPGSGLALRGLQQLRERLLG